MDVIHFEAQNYELDGVKRQRSYDTMSFVV